MSNSTYPTSIDSFYDPNNTTDTMASVPHHTQHGQANDAAVALETKLGTGSSTPTTGSFLTGTGIGVSTWVSSLTSPKITTGLNDSNNNTWIGETPTSSAVNYANITNAATGNAPSYGVAGTDTNIDNNITTQGSGKVRDNGSALVDFRSSFANFIQSGGVWSQISGLAGGMTAARIWINGVEYSVSAVSTHTFGASVDTYIDYTVGTGLVYTAVSNGAASPSLAANSVRIAKAVSGASAITSVTQAGKDSLGNLIYPSGAVGGSQIQSYQIYRSNNATFTTETVAMFQSGWIGLTVGSTIATVSTTVTFDNPFLNLPVVVMTAGGDQTSGSIAYGSGGSLVQADMDCKAVQITKTGFTGFVHSNSGNWVSGNVVYFQWIAVGA